MIQHQYMEENELNNIHSLAPMTEIYCMSGSLALPEYFPTTSKGTLSEPPFNSQVLQVWMSKYQLKKALHVAAHLYSML